MSNLIDSLNSSVIKIEKSTNKVLALIETNVRTEEDKRLFTVIARLAELSGPGYLTLDEIAEHLDVERHALTKKLRKFCDKKIVNSRPLKTYKSDNGSFSKTSPRALIYTLISLGNLSIEVLESLKANGSNAESQKRRAVGWALKTQIKNNLIQRNVDDLSPELRSSIVNSTTIAELSYNKDLTSLIAPADDVLFYKEHININNAENDYKTTVASIYGIANDFDLKILNSLISITHSYLKMKSQKLGYTLSLEESATFEIPAYLTDLCELSGVSSTYEQNKRDISYSLLRLSESTYLVPGENGSMERFRFLQDLTTIGDKEVVTHISKQLTSIDDFSEANLHKVDSLIQRSYGDNFPFNCITFRWTYKYFKDHIYNHTMTELDAQVTRLRPTLYAIFYSLLNDARHPNSQNSFLASNDNVVTTNLRSLVGFTWPDAIDNIDLERHLSKKVLTDLNLMIKSKRSEVVKYYELDDGVTNVTMFMCGFEIEFLIPHFSRKDYISANLNTAVKISLDKEILHKYETHEVTTLAVSPTRTHRRKLPSSDSVRAVIASLPEFKVGKYTVTWNLNGKSYLVSMYHTQDEVKAIYSSVAMLTNCNDVDVKIALDHYRDNLILFSGISMELMYRISSLTLMSKSDIIKYMIPRSRFAATLENMSDIQLEYFFGVLEE